MKRWFSRTVLPLSVLAVAATITTNAPAAIISVTGAQATTGSNYNFTINLFDAQPATDPVAGSTSTTLGAQFGTAGTDPVVVVDFGTDFASKTFNEIYILQGSYGGVKTQTLDYFWSANKVATFETGVDIVAPNLGLFNYTGYGNSTKGRWDIQYSNPTGVTPQAQYLIMRPPTGGSWTLGNFIYEAAFVSTAVPEPASLALLAAGSLMIFHRRRR